MNKNVIESFITISSLVVPVFAVLMYAISLGAAYIAGKILNINDIATWDIFP
jgi:hypothetical protein